MQTWIYSESSNPTTDQLKLYRQRWQPQQSKGAMVLVHGVGEHSGRYRHVAEHYAALGYDVFAHDHRGHGRSEGPRIFIRRFADYTDDLIPLVQMAREAAGSGPVLMLGHSLGGLIALSYALERPDDLTGLILSSPFLDMVVPVPLILRAVAPVLSTLLPRLRLANKIPSNLVCRDPQVLDALSKDSLSCTGVTPRWFLECIRQHERVQAMLPGLRMPTLFLQAGEDHLVSAEATQAAFNRAGIEDKEFFLYPEMYHEILNDQEKERVFHDIDAWLKKHGWPG